MAQYFYINQNSTLPTLRVELIKDGINDFMKSYIFNSAIQNAAVTFSMWDDKGVLRISNESCNIFESEETSCEEKYIIEYPWKARDTKYKGTFIGKFTIKFDNTISDEAGTEFPDGTLIVPIYEDLIIEVK